MNQARGLLERMSDSELNKLILELGNYAAKVRGEYRWRMKDNESLPKGETVKSVVSLALEKVLTGERCWNSEQQPDFRKFMRDVIDSLINHLAGSKDNVLLTTVPEEGTEDEKGSHVGSRTAELDVEWLARKEQTPEQILLNTETQRQHDKAIQMLLEECAEDQTLTKIVKVMLTGRNQCGEIAEIVGIEVKEVYNSMRRLDRKVAAVRRKITSSEIILKLIYV